MVLRRELLLAALAVALLIAALPATALAAPQWVGAQTLDALGGHSDVTTDAQGNSAAVWTAGDGRVLAAERPFGGPWRAPQDLDPGATGSGAQIVALPSGELVAAWVAGSTVEAAERPVGGQWSGPVAISSTCCPLLQDLVAGADGTVLAFWLSQDGTSQTAVKPPGSTTWDPAQDLPVTPTDGKVAVAPDGGAELAYPSVCNSFFQNCVAALYRPPQGDWSAASEPAATAGGEVSGVALAPRPNGSFTLVWGEGAAPVGLAVRAENPPGAVRSADRAAGPTGAWGPPRAVAVLPAAAPGCPSAFGCIDLASRGDTLAAVWQQGSGGASGEIAASLRNGTGAWGPREHVGDPGSGDADPQAALTAAGVGVAAWLTNAGGVGAVARGAHRAGDGTWTQQDLGQASSRGETPLGPGDVVADGVGDAIAGWNDLDGARAAGFDGTGPRFDAFSAPAAGTAGATLPFSAAVVDNWSAVTGLAWTFGDGGGASGSPVSHAYGAPGSYTATAIATDAVGNASQRSGPVAVAPAPTPVGGCGSTDRDKDGVFDNCDVSDGSAAPTPFKTLNATVVSGDVFLKLPAGAGTARAHAAAGAKPPKGFVRLQGAETIPMGSTLDTARGKVRLRSAKDTRRHTQKGVFNAGRFVIRQTRLRRGSRKLITDLRLTGSSFAKACATAKKATISRRRSRKRVRRLFGDGKGNFRTRGRNAAATVRGTRWGVQDRCDGTLVTVRRGRVAVRDLVRHRTVLVKAGHTYLARRR